MKRYQADITLKFEGFIDVEAESKQKAKEIIQKHWGAVLGHVSYTDDSVIEWTINVHPEKQINKIKLL